MIHHSANYQVTKKLNYRNLTKRNIGNFYLSVMDFNEKAFDFIYGIIAIWLFFNNQTGKTDR